MKRSVVVLAGILALIFAQGAVAAHSLSGATTGDVITNEALGLDIDRGEFEPDVTSIPEKLDALAGEHGGAPVMVEQ
mgnify:CR=1 FL=1